MQRGDEESRTRVEEKLIRMYEGRTYLDGTEGLTCMVLGDLPRYVPETYLGMSRRLTCMVLRDINSCESIFDVCSNGFRMNDKLILLAVMQEGGSIAGISTNSSMKMS